MSFHILFNAHIIKSASPATIIIRTQHSIKHNQKKILKHINLYQSINLNLFFYIKYPKSSMENLKPRTNQKFPTIIKININLALNSQSGDV